MLATTLQKVFKTLIDPTRLRILSLLEREELAVHELMQVLDMAQSTVSRHLGILREAGLLLIRREGTSVYYRFVPPGRGEWSETWSMARRSLQKDPATGRDLASLSLLLREREARSRSWFEQVGPEWDSIRKVFNDDVHRARAIGRLLPRKLRVADIGTGTGILARELAVAGVEVVAIDRSHSMLATAREKLEAGGVENVELLLGEASRLPLGDGEVDAAMAHMVLHYVASPGDALREMARVLRPGGRVVVVDFVSHENEWMKQELGILWQGFSLDSLRRWFKEAGLQHTRIEVDDQGQGARNGDLPAIFIASAELPLEESSDVGEEGAE